MSRRTELNVAVANRGPVIVPSGFRNYDVCAQGFVGCMFGCSYCYVRFLIKDVKHDWGDFVRVRMHVEDKLPKELAKGQFKIPIGKKPKIVDGETVIRDNGKIAKETIYKTIEVKDTRLVIGTTTDPYQPIERKYRITRKMLEIFTTTNPQLNKIGIFTRSPIVLDDLDLILKLPRKRVHYTVTPFAKDVMQRIEPIAIATERRWETIRKLKEAGVKVYANISPAMPVVSDQFTEEYARTLAELGVDQFYIDPMQSYSESWEALKVSMDGHPSWPAVREVMEDPQAYQEWKDTFKARWFEAWDKVRYLSPCALAIWSDHASGTWQNLVTGEDLDHKRYGDDLEQ